MDIAHLDALVTTKMAADGIAAPTIRAFLGALHQVVAGETGLLGEAAITPVASLPRLDALPDPGPAGDVLRQLAVIKLNGGLGTGMGLEGAKSLLPVKGADTFLDFTARQILQLRDGGRFPSFYLMNSFATQQDTLDYLRRHPGLGTDLDFLQNRVPKLDATTLEPICWPEQPELEWCPPGHGDLYPALFGGGLLDRLLDAGVRILFVSNSDNLGATVDPAIARYFADSGLSFLMEVAERTRSDRKGGHLARRAQDGRLVLREAAQCPKKDEAAFQDIERHRYFNTNNLWVRLDHLRDELGPNGGALPLALIKNVKTVDPRRPDSPKVLQLESAMGAAIGCFAQAGAIVVGRSRFSPVKATSDLLALRSDAYRVTPDWQLVLDEARGGQPPVVELDARYKLLPDFDRCFAEGVPSLVGCDALKITGPMRFAPGVVCRGRVEFVNAGSEERQVPSGTYVDTVTTL